MNFNQIIGCNMRFSYTHKKIPKKKSKKEKYIIHGPKSQWASNPYISSHT